MNEARSGEKTLLQRMSELGASAQASIPGLYAWGVTVASCAWSRGVPWQTRVVALGGPLVLLASVLVDKDRPAVARHLSVWGLVVSSILVWALVPSAVGPSHFDTTRGVLGMLGWAVFAFASAAPAFPRTESEEARIIERGRLEPRHRGARKDVPFLLVGIVGAVALQAIGWGIEPRERALFVRLYTVAAGMAVLGAFASVALARHVLPTRKKRKARLFGWVLAFLVVAGVALGFEMSIGGPWSP